MLKSSITIFVTILVISIIIFIVFIKKDGSQMRDLPADTTQEIFDTVQFENIPLCFTYQHNATESEPYNISEKIEITINDSQVTGTKNGTQFGPNMSNGYQGTLQGIISGTNIMSLFEYVIEGANGAEQELYTISENILTKHRYQLKELGKILVPDMNSEKTDIVYTKTTCE